MTRVVMQAVVSVDGYIAYPDDTVGPLFDWYGNGEVTVHVNDKWPFNVSHASAGYVQPFWEDIKVTMIGRHLFDTTDGWAGVPAAGDELVVVTHRPLPQEWLARFPDALTDTGQEVATSIGMAVTGTIVAAALTGSIADIGTRAHTFENAVTAATPVRTGICGALVTWAPRRAAQPLSGPVRAGAPTTGWSRAPRTRGP